MYNPGKDKSELNIPKSYDYEFKPLITGESKHSSNKKSRTVLVAVDGSKTSNKAFMVALSQTNPEDKIIVYHGEYLGTTLEGEGQFATVNNPNNERTTSFLRDFFTEQCQKQKRDCEFISHKISGGASVVSRDICSLSRRRNVNNIYLGSRGLSFPTKFLLGSVSWSCLNSCDCSITIVKDVKSENTPNQSIVPPSYHIPSHKTPSNLDYVVPSSQVTPKIPTSPPPRV